MRQIIRHFYSIELKWADTENLYLCFDDENALWHSFNIEERKQQSISTIMILNRKYEKIKHMLANFYIPYESANTKTNTTNKRLP